MEKKKEKKKSFGVTTTREIHKVFFSGKEDKHEHGVGFIVHEAIMNTAMRCLPVFSRLIIIRLREVPFNIIIIVHAYAPTSDYNDHEAEKFYGQLQNVIDQTSKGILSVQGGCSAKVGKHARENWRTLLQ